MRQKIFMSKNKGIVLLSGGLDSVCALAYCLSFMSVDLALTFDYGQSAFEQECLAAKKVADFYKIEHKIIKLDWLRDLISSSLNNDTKTELQKYWIPNRNALFINVAACFADVRVFALPRA